MSRAPRLERSTLNEHQPSGYRPMRRTAAYSLAALLLVLASHPVAAQLPADSLFDRLVGRWVLHGTIARRTTTHDVTFDWMLGHEYLRMHEVSRERNTD